MRTEIRWKAIHRITHGRLVHTMATCPLCSENRRSKKLQRPHKPDRAERRVFALELGRKRMRAARPAYGGLISEYCASNRDDRRTA
jgi:hypothetical protein